MNNDYGEGQENNPLQKRRLTDDNQYIHEDINKLGKLMQANGAQKKQATEIAETGA